ncbi:MAG: 30S ribosomal protein S20, partial [Clostridia bacterium]|nr:30S ribosomal protein S20 [Clostridia bacterium]
AADKDELVKLAVKKIDQACAKGLLHKNNAARKKSALVTRFNKVNA